jgi:hypothetical protein
MPYRLWLKPRRQSRYLNGNTRDRRAKFKRLILSMSGFVLSNVANILIILILDDLCLPHT